MNDTELLTLGFIAGVALHCACRLIYHIVISLKK